MVDQIASLSPTSAAAVQNITALAQKSASAQQNLATGKQVNAVLDNPVAFFQAQSLLSQSNSLIAGNASIDQTNQTVAAATSGLTGISNLLDLAKGIANQAQASSSPTDRANLGAQFNQIQQQISLLASDTSYQGTNLINYAPGSSTANLNGAGSSPLTVNGKASDAASLGVNASNNWGSANWATGTANIQGDLNAVLQATQTVQGNAATLNNQGAILSVRGSFNQSLSNIDQSGGANLTQADIATSAAQAIQANARQASAVTAYTAYANSQKQAAATLFA